jgi:hypothetical protein
VTKINSSNQTWKIVSYNSICDKEIQYKPRRAAGSEKRIEVINPKAYLVYTKILVITNVCTFNKLLS